jgi:hypothetical protein
MVPSGTRSEGRAVRLLVWIPIFSLVVVAAGYVAIIRNDAERPADILTAPFVVAYLGLMAALLAISVLDTSVVRGLRPALRGAASAGLLVLGVLGLFSVGLPILIAGVVATAGAVVTVASRPTAVAAVSAVVAGLVAVAVLLAGFEFVWHYLVCPSTGISAGTTAGIFVSSYSYECSYGHLTINR